MGLLNHLIFDGVKSSDFGVFISGEGTFNSPARRGEMVSIPGRNGALFMDEGVFENIPGKYPAYIGTKNEKEFREKLAAFKSEILSRGNYKRLSDTYHPNEFRLAVYRSGLDVEPEEYNRSGGFELEFDCKPQRFLISGTDPQVYTENGVINNPTLFESSPIIKVTGNGTVAIGPYMFTVRNSHWTIIIDTELMEAYIPGNELEPLTDENNEIITEEIGIEIEIVDGYLYPRNMNSYIEFSNSVMPKIPPGEQTVRMSNTINELIIIPRWWYL